LGVAAIAIMAFFAAARRRSSATAGGPRQQIGATDLGGVCAGRTDPKAGVWVIAGNQHRPTKMVKIVVTDEPGGYVLPDLPKAKLHGVGARLRPDRFAQGPDRARQGSST